MSYRILPREFGTVLVCNGCGATEQTALVGVTRNRDWFRGKGWGKGTDPGTSCSPALPERTITVTRSDGSTYDRKVAAKPEHPGRPSTLSHDLCPTCKAKDNAATRERKAKRTTQVAARDLKRKERDAAARKPAL